MGKTLSQLTKEGLWENFFVDTKTGEKIPITPELYKQWVDNEPRAQNLRLTWQEKKKGDV